MNDGAESPEISVVDRGNGIAALELGGWRQIGFQHSMRSQLGSGLPDVTGLQVAIGSATEAAFKVGVRRVEAQAPTEDRLLRRALLRSGFRVEGTRRAVLGQSDGSFGDLTLFSRLAGDRVGGPAGFSAVMNTALPRKRLIAHVLFRDTEQRILLCETAFKPDWELPGGIVEPLEPPRQGAIREVREELGIELGIGRLLVADWLPPYLGWEDAFELIFDGGVVAESDLATFTLQESEIRQVRLVSLAEAANLVTPLSHRRLTVALSLGEAGADAGPTAYLENGYA